MAHSQITWFNLSPSDSRLEHVLLRNTGDGELAVKLYADGVPAGISTTLPELCGTAWVPTLSDAQSL